RPGRQRPSRVRARQPLLRRRRAHAARGADRAERAPAALPAAPARERRRHPLEIQHHVPRPRGAPARGALKGGGHMAATATPTVGLEQMETFAVGLDHAEGICLAPDGHLYVGGEAGQLYRIEADDSVTELLSTGGFMLGLAAD